MKMSARFTFVLVALFLSGGAGVAHAEHIAATLTGYEEVPSVSTIASGEFRGFINDRGVPSIDYELRYSGLQGTIQQAHIHVAQLSVNGSIVIWLCQTATTQAPVAVRDLTPFCPQSGTVTGHITAANVIAGATTQQLAAGELTEVIRAMRADSAYVNVHTTPSPGGEIRGQIQASARR